ncbi:MAG: hypothetical protein R3F41_02715 [Gammaproteobacteria bacterium]|nr:hypothetical protein [Pseudomonadales bacterium]MCP5345795.1 hypothetical protein [Pseudomonadales bacterium]
MTLSKLQRKALIFLTPLILTCAVNAAEDFSPPRTADGSPDFNGIWQAMGSAHWNIEPHAADFPPLPQLGAWGSVPAGLGIVVGGEIPYTPEARQQQQQNKDGWLEKDPYVKCYMPGVPRANYLPFPFQIVQSPDHIIMAYEFASASRIVYMNRPDFEAPVYSWMGHSRGYFEGDTLVIDVTDQMPDTWFDHAGNHHTEALKVTERYTHTGPDTLLYEATLEDPNVYTRPWTIRMPLYRRLDENMQLLEFKCVEFVEEMMYGHLRRISDEDDQRPNN